MRTIPLDELRNHVGEDIGHSPWHEVTQDQVNLFADATGDHQWIHVDPSRAQSGPFGGPIAHGYLTLSLASYLLPQLWQVTGTSMGVNYGLNKLRFPSPVPVGGRLRIGAKLANVEAIDGGAQVTLDLTFEVEGTEKPACVAQAVYRYYA